jgi:hypothetical protein
LANGNWTSVMIDAPPQGTDPWKKGFIVMRRKFADPRGRDQGITLELEAERGAAGFRFGLATEKKAVAGLLIGFPTVGGQWIDDEPEVGRTYSQRLGPYNFEVKISEMQTQLVRDSFLHDRKFRRVWLRFRMLRTG